MQLKQLKTALKNQQNPTSRIIFLNNYYYPDCSATSQLLTDLAEHLAATGYEVIVVASRRLYDSSDARLPATDEKNGVQIRRIWTTRFGRKSLIGRGFDYVTFHLTALLFLLFLAKRHDTIVSKTDPPLIGILACIVAQLKGAYLIHWCQDVFPEIASALGVRMLPRFLSNALTKLRNVALQSAKANITISDAMSKTLLLEGGVHPDRVHTIHNWPQRIIKPLTTVESTRRREWNLEKRFVIGYSGNLGRAHLPQHVLRLTHVLTDIPDLTMLFVGGGHGMKVIQEAAHHFDRRNLTFKPLQPKDDLAHSLSVPDLHLISLNPACERYLMPSKYYGILAAGRAMIFLGNPLSTLAREIIEHDCGIVLDFTDKSSWKDQVVDLKEQPDRVSRMGANARQLFEQRYTTENAFQAWERIFLSVQTTKAVTAPAPAT